MEIRTLRRQIPAFIFVIGFFSLLEFCPAYRENSLFAPGGETVRATGEVVSTLTRRRSRSCFLEIRYVFPVGQDFVSTLYKSRCNALPAFEEGDSIEIRYLPSDPSVNRPAAINYNQSWLGSVVVVSFAFIVLGLFWFIRSTVDEKARG
jgi:hypothetical protein